MNLPVRMTDRARQELEDAFNWWAMHRSSEQAARWYNGFLDRLSMLSTTADRCTSAREFEQFPYDLRELHYGVGRRATHRALFTIRPDAVLVVSIRHVAQRDVTPDDIPS
jgi:plasmid stabilization system protein ParE